MGVWRYRSELMARMMSRFPNSDQVYGEEGPNMRGCSSGSSENPRREILKHVLGSLVLG